MHTRRIRIIALLCIVSLCFCSCQQRKDDPTITESQVWETMPTLTYGQMAYEKLEATPWYSGRAEAVGNGRFSETAKGYYYLNAGTLYYCDKSDLNKWVPTCAKPNCMHSGNNHSCNAGLVSNTFILRNNRIWYSTSVDAYPQLYTGEGQGVALFSKSANGEDTRLEYVIEDSLISGGGQINDLFGADYWIVNATKLNADGSCTAKVYYTTASGTDILYEQTSSDPNFASVMYYILAAPFNGEGKYNFLNKLLGTNVYYSVSNGELVPTDAVAYGQNEGYLLGNILRQFRPNDGYYDINLKTKEEIKLADARLNNSRGFIMLPNCIVEHTLASETHPEGALHAMEIFDGESWRSVTLPEELRCGTDILWFSVLTVASDRILFAGNSGNGIAIYQVMLHPKELTLEYCGQLGI